MPRILVEILIASATTLLLFANCQPAMRDSEPVLYGSSLATPTPDPVFTQATPTPSSSPVATPTPSPTQAATPTPGGAIECKFQGSVETVNYLTQFCSDVNAHPENKLTYLQACAQQYPGLIGNCNCAQWMLVCPNASTAAPKSGEACSPEFRVYQGPPSFVCRSGVWVPI